MQADWPSRRHDATLWQPSDTDSRKMAGKDLAAHAGLLQTGGDWRGVCISLLGSEEMLLDMSSGKLTWLHFAFRDATLNAAWSAHTYKSRGFVFVQRASGICPSTLFQIPHASVDTAMIEWLHTMDQGVLGDIIGSSSSYGRGITLHALRCKGPRG